MAEISTKPYLIRALYEWCADNGYRPYIAVAVDERTVVPREFVRNGEIVLNISAVATNRLTIGNELLEFEARFGGVARQVSIPIENISAIFAQENGHGMAFEVHRPPADEAPPHEEAAGAPARAPSLAAVPREAPAAPSGAGAVPEGDAPASRAAPGAQPRASEPASSSDAASPSDSAAPQPPARA
ncbi:MAG: ClpXP protease specificity-enhancing factor, partial [Burkholderiales bacterium]|nr:ClpXP protease specificity-enhancing factor [Burkholderiales bacterium]